MAVMTPDIGTSTANAGAQKTAEKNRLITVRSGDLARIIGQGGSAADLISQIEGTQAGADQASLAGAGQVAAAGQAGRTATLNRDNQQRTITQGTADQAAAQARADAAGQAARNDDALKAVNDAYAGYNDAFFNDYAAGIVNAGLPTIRDQYKEKNRQADTGLSQKGIGQSSAAARIVGRIRGAQAADEANLAQSAANAAETLRANIEQSRATALQTALAAAGIKQSVPVAGASIGDIMKARGQAGGASTPGLSLDPAALPPSTGAGGGTKLDFGQGGGQGGGQSGGAKTPGGPVPGDSDGDGNPDTIFNSDPRGGQIAGVDETGGWSYAHYPGTDGYDGFAGGDAAGGVQSITIPTVKTPRTAALQDQPANLAAAGFTTPLQPPPASVGDTTALTPRVDTMRARKPGAGQAGGLEQRRKIVDEPAGPKTSLPQSLAAAGTPEALGGTQKGSYAVPQIAPRTPDQQAALNAASLPIELGGTLDRRLINQRAANVDYLPEALGGTGRGAI